MAAVTARRLEHATGIASTSLTRLLNQLRRTDPATGRPVGLARGGVLVVDEASMVDTRTLTRLLAHTRAAQATLVLVGDPAELSEVGAGGLFTALTRHPNTITLTDNRRQAEAWERRALADLRAGDPQAAVAAYAEHGRVHTAPADRLAEQVVQDYLAHLVTADQQHRPGQPVAPASERVVMLAVRKVDVTELNDTTRRALLAAGRLGPDRGHHRARRPGPGVPGRRPGPDHRQRPPPRPAQRHPRHRHRRRPPPPDDHPRADGDQRVTVRADWAERHLDHGYAMTCHKAQGATVDIALLYGTTALTREAGYVALSRGRTANHLYVADDTDQRNRGLEPGYLDELAAQLSQRRTQTLATRQLPRTQPGRWQPSRSTQPDQPRIEGISR